MEDGSSSAPHVKIRKEGNGAEITIKIPEQNEVNFNLMIDGEVPVHRIYIDFCKRKRTKLSDCLNLKFQTSRAGDYLDMVTKQDASLRSLFLDFCDQQGLMYKRTVFTFDGVELHENQTPKEVDLEDGDVIDVIPRRIRSMWERCTSYKPSAGTKCTKQ